MTHSKNKNAKILLCVCIYACLYVHVCIYICVCVCVCVPVATSKLRCMSSLLFAPRCPTPTPFRSLCVCGLQCSEGSGQRG